MKLPSPCRQLHSRSISAPGALLPQLCLRSPWLSQPPPPLPLPLLPCKAVLLLLMCAHPMWPLLRGDIILWLAPLHHLHHIRGQPGGPRCPRGPGLQAQGSRQPRDPRRHSHCLIRALLEPWTYPLHPLSGDLTSIAAPSWGILTTVREICTGRFTTISRYLPRTWSSKTLCSSCRDTTWSCSLRRVVIKFYHTMMSRREANPTALYFSIDGWPGILRASDITANLHLSVVLANAADYRQRPHPSTREMVLLLSMDTTTGTILFKRQLSHRMLLIDHILRSNLFSLQHIVQRRGAILEALYRISEGFWFSPVELIMTALFHFEDRVHHWSLSRAESTPLLFPQLLCQMLEHIGFPAEPRFERRRGCEATLSIDQWQAMPRTLHLPPPGPAKDQLAADIEDLPPIAEHT